MSYTKSAALRNTQLSAINTLAANGTIEIRSGARPASPDSADSGTLLGVIALDATPFATPSAGSMALADVPVEDPSANAGGTIGHARFKSSGGVAFVDLAATVTGGGGDIEFVSLLVTATEPIRITSLNLSQS